MRTFARQENLPAVASVRIWVSWRNPRLPPYRAEELLRPAQLTVVQIERHTQSVKG